MPTYIKAEGSEEKCPYCERASRFCVGRHACQEKIDACRHAHAVEDVTNKKAAAEAEAKWRKEVLLKGHKL